MSLTFDPKDIKDIAMNAKQVMGAISNVKAIASAAKRVKTLGGLIALGSLTGLASLRRPGGTSGNLGIAEIVITPRGFGGLVFDAIFEESHTSEMAVTDNPVETGVSITDHAFMKPYKIRISAGVSNTPVADRATIYGDGDERIKNAWDALTRLQASREPFEVQTGLKLYKNMVCTSLNAVQDKDSAGALVFTAELREVIIVYTQSVKYPPRKGKAANQAGKKKESGQKQAKEVEAAQPKKSALKRLAAVAGF